jgi:Ca2+-binding RTX toxin-like protein
MKNAPQTLRLSGENDELFLWSNTSWIIDAGDGNDWVVTSGSMNDTLKGGAGNDYLDAGDGNNSLLGGAGDDMLYGGFGNDTIRGGDGMDLLESWGGTDVFTGEAGDDWIFYGDWGTEYDGDYATMYGGIGDDVLVAWGGASVRMYGGVGGDQLIDYSGNARMYGEAGNDFIIGVDGDVMVGGDGADTFGLLPDLAHDEGPSTITIVDFALNTRRPDKSDKITLENLIGWNEDGYAIPIFDPEDMVVRGNSLFIPYEGGEHEIAGVGNQITLIGGPDAAMDLGLILIPYFDMG